MAAAAQIAALPPAEKGDVGAEDAAEDEQDEGAPARNDMEVQPPIAPGTQVIEFYSKTPQYKEFSNFHMVPLTLDGKEWPSVEHYFQAMKFFANPEYQETIRKAKTPTIAKRLGKTREMPIRADWNIYRDTVMYMALKEKFSERHPELRDKLLATGTAVLKEASPMDNYWGIGRSKKGQNKMGLLLMKVREEIRPAVAAPPAAPLVAPSVDADVAHAAATQEEAALPPPAPDAPPPLQAAPPPPPVPQQATPPVPQQVPQAAPPPPQAAPPPPPQAAPPPPAPQPPANAWQPGVVQQQVPGAVQPPPGPVLNIQEVDASALPPAADSDVKVITLNAPIPPPKNK
jgi:ribA/ribD-fused uncharacterized protein